MLQSEGFDFDPIILCCKVEKKPEGVAVGVDGMVAHPLDVWEVVMEELTDTGIEFHVFRRCQREKSNRRLRLRASATLRYIVVCLYSLWPR